MNERKTEIKKNDRQRLGKKVERLKKGIKRKTKSGVRSTVNVEKWQLMLKNGS